VPGLVDTGLLAGGADEQAGKEKLREGWLFQKVMKAAQQIRPPQKGAVRRGGAADDDVVAPAGAGVSAVEHEFLRGQTRLAGGFIEGRGAATISRQLCMGWMLTSMTPGSGVIFRLFSRGS
jgi:hypothetical protein